MGPVAVKPTGVIKSHSFKTVLLNGSGPRSSATWRPKAHAGSLNTLGYKSGSQTLNSKTISSVTQTGPLASSSPSDTALRLPEIGSSHAISSVACNSEVLPEFGSSFATSSSDCNSAVLPGFGLGSSTLSGAIVFEAPNSLSAPLKVLPRSGFLESQPPPSTLMVGSSNLVRIAVGEGSEEGNLENLLVVPTQHAEGFEISELKFTNVPHALCPRISDFVGDLSKT